MTHFSFYQYQLYFEVFQIQHYNPKQEPRADMALVKKLEPKIRLGTRVIGFAGRPEALNLPRHQKSLPNSPLCQSRI